MKAFFIMPLAIVLVAAQAIFTGAAAQNTAYRCGNSYSQSPCADGRVVDVQDGRTPSQAAQTSVAAGRDARAADAMEKDRLRQQAQAAPAYVAPAPAAATAPPATPATAGMAEARGKKKPRQAGPGKPAKPEQFTAVVPGSAKAAKEKKAAEKAARKAEKKAEKQPTKRAVAQAAKRPTRKKA